MTRDQSLLQAAATLLGHNRDTAYGPAHAVRDALEIEQELYRQEELGTDGIRLHPTQARNGGAL